MAEKTDELRKDEGILSQTDKDIISTVASNSDNEFVEKYTDKVSESDEITDDPEQIRSQIEKTRREMGETIDEIQERLSYENISEQVSERVSEALDAAKATAYQATIGKAEMFMKNVGRELKVMGKEISKTEAGKTVLSNPVPFALIGLGAGVLLFNAFGKKKSSSYGNGRDFDYDDSPSMLKSAGDKVSGTFGSISETTSDVYENVSGIAGRAYEGVTHAAGSAYGKVNETAHQAYEKAGELGNQARKQYDHYIEENPLVIGAVALAAGAAVGFAIPSTRYESKLLGDARDQLMQKANQQVKGLVQRAEDTAKEQIDKVKTVAKESIDKARETGKDQDLVH